MTKTAKRKVFRRFAITLAILALIGVAGMGLAHWWMKQPLYQFGSVRNGDNLRSPLQPPSQTETNRWQVENDISLAFQTYGDGHPVLIVHSGPGIPYQNLWKGLEPLVDQYQFFFYHQRGCGDSSRPFDQFQGNFYQNMIELEQTLGLGAQIADIERIRQILQLEKVTLIGHSFGGLIAALYAAEFPERVEKLILVAPAGVLTPPDEERDIFRLARRKLEPESMKAFDELKGQYFDFANIFRRSEEELVRLHSKLGEYLLTAFGEKASDLTSTPTAGGWSVFALYFSLGRTQDFRPALNEITAPTLIIQGVDDDMAMAGSRSYQPIKGSRFLLIERESPEKRAGHFVFDQAPGKFANLIEQFLAE